MFFTFEKLFWSSSKWRLHLGNGTNAPGGLLGRAHYFFGKSHIHGAISNLFGNTEHLGKEAPLCGPNCRIKMNVQPEIIVYIKGSRTSGKA